MQRFTALHKAAQKGDEQETLQLLEEGCSASAKDSEGRTPLHHAVMRGHLGVVQLLMNRGSPELLLSKDILGCTPVHLAAVQNQVTLILLLVSALLREEGGTTPLHEIARRNCLQDFMGFLHLGWDIAAKEEVPGELAIEVTPEWEAVAAEIDLTRPGLASVRSTMGWSPLHMAAMEGKVTLIHRLVKEFGCSLTQRSANSWTPLHYAAAHNQVGAIEELVRLGCDADVKDSVSSTPMHVAAGEGHLEAILLLVQLGCAAAVKDRDGCTPLYCAAAWNQLEAVRQLDRLGCPSWQKSLEGRTPVHVAAEQGWVDLIDLLVKELKNKVDSRDTYQFTPLHSAANGGHVKTIQKLIHFSHDVDVKDYLGRTPLHYAAMHGRVSAVEELVRQGASLKEKDIRGGYTPLHLAADAGQCEAIHRLAALGAPLEARSTKGWTPLGLATFKGPANVDAIGTLIELGSKVSTVLDNTALETPLHIAARCGRLDIIKKLLMCNVPVNVRAKDGSYPLHYAAAFGQSHVIEALVKAGCNVNCEDDAHNTPLHLAAGCGFYDTVERLVELGADANARDIMACTPLQNAAHGTYSALATMPASNGSPTTGGSPGPQRGSNATAQNSTQNQQPLTLAQTATQLALSTGTAARNGKVPVRTGLAWASLGGLAGTGMEWTSGLWGGATGAGIEPSGQAGTNLMQLLKRATRRRNGATSNTTSPDYSLGISLKADDKATDGGLEALLRRSEALRAGGLEQDRRRLLTVAARLVDLGAQVDARDAEGRTALHLAAGCGDTAMVLQLVQLGSHVNCRDSVGGTPMHHAAMANKKEMMFELARLGCDWRARAEGIDGATASFVLCGQHGKTTRQQKLVEAKLKRVHQEGLAARSQVRQLAKLQDRPERGGGEAGDAGALADANMAALLEQVQLEDQGIKVALAKRKRKKKRVPKGKGTPLDDKAYEDISPSGVSHSILLDVQASETYSDRFKDISKSVAMAEAGAQVEDLQDEQLGDAAQAGVGADRNPEDAGAAFLDEYDTSSKHGTSNGHSAAVADLTSLGQEAARKSLDDAILEAVTLLDSRKQNNVAQEEEQLQAAAGRLDDAIGCAVEAGVSAKYGKKVRKRLQHAVDVLQGKIPLQQAQPPGPSVATEELQDGEIWGHDVPSEDDGPASKPSTNGQSSLPPSNAAPGCDAPAKPLLNPAVNSQAPRSVEISELQSSGSVRSPRVLSPRTPVSRSAKPAAFQMLPPPRHAEKPQQLGRHAWEKGQEVQKPVAQAGVSRTPKRVLSAKAVPAREPTSSSMAAIPPGQQAVCRPLSALPPAYTEQGVAPVFSKDSPPPKTAADKEVWQPQLQHQLNDVTQPTTSAASLREPAPRAKWEPFPVSQWQPAEGPWRAPSHLGLGTESAVQEQGSRVREAALSHQSAVLNGPALSGSDHLHQRDLGPHLSGAPSSSMWLPQSQAAAGRSEATARSKQNLLFSELSPTAPQWLPVGGKPSLLPGLIGQPQAGSLPASIDEASVDGSNRSTTASPHQKMQGWQLQQPMAARSKIHEVDKSASGHTILKDAFGAFPACQGGGTGSLYSWNAPHQDTRSSSMQIWQNPSNGWPQTGVEGVSKDALNVGGMLSPTRHPALDPQGCSVDYGPVVDNSIGSQLAASVLAAEDRRPALGAFTHCSSRPISRPGYDLW